jgi:hypothetical protein
VLDIVAFTHQQMNRRDPLMVYMQKIYDWLDQHVPAKRKQK